MAQVTNRIACCSEVGLQYVRYLGPCFCFLHSCLLPSLPLFIPAALHPCLPLSLPPSIPASLHLCLPPSLPSSISASASFNSTSFHLTLFLSLPPMAPGFSEDYQTLSGGREQFGAGDGVPRGAGGWEDVGGHQLLPPPKGPRRHRGGK